MPITLDGTNGITTPNETVTGNISAATYNNGQLAGNRNKIINGAMMIDQRNAGASVTPTTDNNVFPVDRFVCRLSQASKFSAQQSSTAPTGFVNSLKITSLSAYTVGSSEFFAISQNIEGLNCADLSWGTAAAKSVTLSFQVYSSLTGTFGGTVYNSNADTSYPFSYSVSSANTWTSISVVIPGPTIGNWLTTNVVGINVSFSLGAGASVSGTAGSWAASLYRSATGATSVVGTNGATFYITGVQLEKGATATPFENRLYGTELALCQRYFQINLGVSSNEGLPVQLVGGYTFAANWYKWVVYPLPVQMRASPTVTWYPNNNSTSEPGKARYYTSASGGAGNNLTPYGFGTCPQYLLLKVYNEHNSFTCYGVGAAYDASAEL